MISAPDPSSMLPDAILLEIARIISTGYIRLLLSRRKALEAGHPHAALCVQTVSGLEAVPGKERA
jgi:hypothetical protein